jgi:hypothetical protein
MMAPSGDAWNDADWTGEVLFLPEPTGRSAMIATLRSHWDGLRGARNFPRRGEIDPVEINTCLPYISLINYQAEPYRVQFRLIGAEVARLYGRDARGRWLDEMPWAHQGLIDTAHVYAKLFQERQPLFGLSYTSFESHNDHVFEWAVFPLSDDGVNVTHGLSLDDYTMVTPPTRRPF